MYSGSPTLAVSEVTATNSVSGASPLNSSPKSMAVTDSGSSVKPIVVVKAPARSWEVTMPAATNKANQIAIVLHGFLALALANVSVPNDITYSLLDLGARIAYTVSVRCKPCQTTGDPPSATPEETPRDLRCRDDRHRNPRPAQPGPDHRRCRCVRRRPRRRGIVDAQAGRGAG